MYTCHYYLIVEPLLQQYVDNESVKYSTFATIKTKTKDYNIFFYTNTNQLYMVRIDIPDLDKEVIPERDLSFIQLIKEHLLSVLRLTYEKKVSIFPRSLWTFIEKGKSPSFSIKIEEVLNPDFDPYVENIRNVFVNTFPIRVQIKLLSDAQDNRLPLQYRYLSIYKLLELEFKKNNKWTNEFQDFISGFQEEFDNFNKKIKLVNYIHAIRDKCAHITTGKNVLGITQLSNKDMLELDQFLPFIITVCSKLINDKHKNLGFHVSHSRKPPLI